MGDGFDYIEDLNNMFQKVKSKGKPGILLAKIWRSVDLVMCTGLTHVLQVVVDST